MDRVILHSDMNAFYASVECLHRPEIRNLPVAVGGDPEQRHGIILTKNQIAKKYGIKTGEALWQARQKCPNLIIVPPNFPLYLRFSRLAKTIYAEYTDLVEPFGIDEAWLDVSKSTNIFGTGEQIAEEIRQKIKSELGITVSIGVSFNKIFAKLGSDYKKPDAITVFSKENFRETVWPIPVEDLLGVGSATKRKLYNRSINTIGELANTEEEFLKATLGKWGSILYCFANGWDTSQVAHNESSSVIKSIGNSTTTPRDLTCDEDAKMLIYTLAESVGMRLREQGLKARTVGISIRDTELFSFQRQAKLPRASCLTLDIVRGAYSLFKANYSWPKPIRSLGVRVSDLVSGNEAIQLDLFDQALKQERQETLDKTIDIIRNRFGNLCLQRGTQMQDTKLTGFDPKTEHVIHPVGYF